MYSLTTALGGQASYAISTRWAVLLPQARVEWEHEYENDSREIDARFVHDSSRTPVRIKTNNPDRNYFNVGIGLSAVFPRGKSAFVDYETALGIHNVTEHNIAVGFRIEF